MQIFEELAEGKCVYPAAGITENGDYCDNVC